MSNIRALALGTFYLRKITPLSQVNFFGEPSGRTSINFDRS